MFYEVSAQAGAIPEAREGDTSPLFAAGEAIMDQTRGIRSPRLPYSTFFCRDRVFGRGRLGITINSLRAANLFTLCWSKCATSSGDSLAVCAARSQPSLF